MSTFIVEKEFLGSDQFVQKCHSIRHLLNYFVIRFSASQIMLCFRSVQEFKIVIIVTESMLPPLKIIPTRPSGITA
jgi:hypothetical protein